MVQLSKGYSCDGPVNGISWSFFLSHDQLPDHNEHMPNGPNTGMFFGGSSYVQLNWLWQDWMSLELGMKNGFQRSHVLVTGPPKWGFGQGLNPGTHPQTSPNYNKY